MPKSRKKANRERSVELLKGWDAIGRYLGIGSATAQRWAKSGMPVRREGRYTVADPEEIQRWLGREAHMPAPAHVVKDWDDTSAALKESIAAVRRGKRQR